MGFKSYSLGVILALSSIAVATPASANAVWIDDKPVFLSDIERRQPRTERRIEQPRYRPPVSQPPVYPKHASGGPQPVIAPEPPEIVPLLVSAPVVVAAVTASATSLAPRRADSLAP